MSYCNIDEAYDIPFDNHVIKYDEMLKRDVQSLNSSPKFNQNNIYTTQGEVDSSLHVGTNISDLKRGCDNLPCGDCSTESPHKNHKNHKNYDNVNKNDQNCLHPQNLRTVDCDEEQEKISTSKKPMVPFDEFNNKEILNTKKNLKHHYHTHSHKQKQHIHHPDEYHVELSTVFANYINCKDIKELLYVIILGIIIIFLIDLITKLSKKF